jgi:hypothetical protein
MARFMTRVELHYAPHDGDDYAKLHEETEERGFKRTISSSDATYHLPPAMYHLEGDYGRDGVLQPQKTPLPPLATRFGHRPRVADGRTLSS